MARGLSGTWGGGGRLGLLATLGTAGVVAATFVVVDEGVFTITAAVGIESPNFSVDEDEGALPRNAEEGFTPYKKS